MNDSPNLLSDAELDRLAQGNKMFGPVRGHLSADKELALIAQAKLANEIPALKARIAELESLLTQAACDKIEATAFGAMKERVEAIENGLAVIHAHFGLIDVGYSHIALYGDQADFREFGRAKRIVDIDPDKPGESFADALIALSKEQGNG